MAASAAAMAAARSAAITPPAALGVPRLDVRVHRAPLDQAAVGRLERLELLGDDQLAHPRRAALHPPGRLPGGEPVLAEVRPVPRPVHPPLLYPDTACGGAAHGHCM